jgi:hypothetical protein
LTRRLWLLNLGLLALCVLAGWRLQTQAERARQAQEQFLSRRNTVNEPPPVQLPPPPPPVSPAAYLQVAQQMLLSGDRNPEVVVEVVAPKPMPPLPHFHGVMSLGGPPRAVLSPGGGGEQKSYGVGDTVGDYKLAAMTQLGLVFEWEGKKVPVTFAELRAKQAQAEPPPAAASERPERGNAPAASNVSPVAAVAKVSPSELQRPGDTVSETMRTCQNGDTSPAGTTVDGFRKVLRPTPFGNQCYWERVQ